MGITRQRNFVSRNLDLIALFSTCAFVAIFVRSIWFFGDDWNFLLNRIPEWADGSRFDAVFRPHGSHIHSSTSILYIAIAQLVGLDSTLPFLVALFVAHFVSCAAVLRISERFGANMFSRVVGGVLVGIMGSGSENLVWFFQFGFMTGIGLSLWSFYLVCRNPHTSSVLVGTAAGLLNLFALFSATTAIPLALATSVLLMRRREYRVLIVYVSLSLLPFVTFLVTYGKSAFNGDEANFDQIIPFVSFGFFSSLERALLFGSLGLALVFVSLGKRVGKSGLMPEKSMLILAITLFYLLTARGRAGLGIEQAGASRYSYYAVIMLAPLLITLLSWTWQNYSEYRFLVSLFLLLILLSSFGQLTSMRNSRMFAFDLFRGRVHMAAAYSLWPYADASIQPEPQWNPDISIGQLRTLVDQEMFTPVVDWSEQIAIRSGLDFGVRQVVEGDFAQLTKCENSSISSVGVPKGEKLNVPFEGEMFILMSVNGEVLSEVDTPLHEVALTISSESDGGDSISESKKFEWEGPVTGLRTLALKEGSFLTFEGAQNLQICVIRV